MLLYETKMTDLSDAAEEKKVMIMRNEKERMKQNDAPAGINIKLCLRVALLALCAWFFYKIGASAICVIGVYILLRSVLKIIRLSVSIFFSILSVMVLMTILSLILVLIF
ncbi:hypothetical protein CLV62_1013 [Dysgonomonas alginatilytica]|uniref:Uncharacterized protein n=1 Tax=Dysgonomonas alginatilytica TaxID=1605892 RepID=A0A2V3PV87_9BACT|nr:hypothetical protein CLV62_1013 [Dysgonomonas alginatilytica]